MLSIVTINEKEKWDDIVKSFNNYDVCYLSGYAKAFQLNGEGEPVLFYYDDNKTRAINVVMKRDIAKASSFEGRLSLNTYFDLSTPYGYGGFWIEGDDYESVNTVYDSYCRENRFVSEFVRFHLFSGYQLHFSGVSVSKTHNVIRSLDIELDEMLLDFEHKVRKNIKTADKAGLVVEVDTTGKRFDDFLEIYYETIYRTEAANRFLFSKEFFKEINNLKDNYVYLHVLCDNKVISTELVLYGSENCYSFLGGTKQNYFSLRPNDFLKYEIIKWAKDSGLKRYILGGGYGEDDGIFKYKKSFAPNGVCNFYIGKKIFDNEQYNELAKMYCTNKSANIDTGFFPIYRA